MTVEQESKNVKQDRTHAYKKGDVVPVYNTSHGGKLFCEGFARIKELMSIRDTYRVEFFYKQPGERHAERFVMPNATALVDAASDMQEALRVTELVLSEMFNPNTRNYPSEMRLKELHEMVSNALYSAKAEGCALSAKEAAV